MPIAVAIAGVFYVVVAVDRFKDDSSFYGFRPLHATSSEVLYGFGRPALVRNEATPWQSVEPSTPIEQFRRWQYSDAAGGTWHIGFDAAGRSDEVSCYEANLAPTACPSAFGVRLGDLEDRTAYFLGPAPIQILSGPSKIMRYPDIGLEFELQQFKLRRITVRSDKASILGRIPRLIRFAIP